MRTLRRRRPSASQPGSPVCLPASRQAQLWARAAIGGLTDAHALCAASRHAHTQASPPLRFPSSPVSLPPARRSYGLAQLSMGWRRGIRCWARGRVPRSPPARHRRPASRPATRPAALTAELWVGRVSASLRHWLEPRRAALLPLMALCIAMGRRRRCRPHVTMRQSDTLRQYTMPAAGPRMSRPQPNCSYRTSVTAMR